MFLIYENRYLVFFFLFLFFLEHLELRKYSRKAIYVDKIKENLLVKKLPICELWKFTWISDTVKNNFYLKYS